MRSVYTRVHRGVRFLDKMCPGWEISTADRHSHKGHEIEKAMKIIAKKSNRWRRRHGLAAKNSHDHRELLATWQKEGQWKADMAHSDVFERARQVVETYTHNNFEDFKDLISQSPSLQELPPFMTTEASSQPGMILIIGPIVDNGFHLQIEPAYEESEYSEYEDEDDSE